MSDFRIRYEEQMRQPDSRFEERFPITEAHDLKDNLELETYADALKYLTGDNED